MSSSTKISYERLTKTLLALTVMAGLTLILLVTINWWMNQRSQMQAGQVDRNAIIDGSDQPYDKSQILIDDTAEPLKIVEKPTK